MEAWGVGHHSGHGQKPVWQGVMLVTTIAVLVVVVLPVTALVYGKANHDGWPINQCQWREHPAGPGCGVYRSHNEDQNGVIRGTDRNDELLGGHGDDTVYGGPAGDVIWGDFWPCCQPSGQDDHMYGGPGNDWIYASHGTNYINAGPGNDTIKAHFGRGGFIDCGPGNDVVFVSHKSKPHYTIRNCERISFAVE